ncbi:KDP operon transcriptional regulatory protein KdpE [Clostridioides difficile]|nr:KDP operon transcriptional regulatory protein KdpE [Clostridioides difficile]
MQIDVLIIDGDKNSSQELKNFLEGKGINVYLAYNCKDAIIKIFSKKFDLIFLEIILVDGDGWDFCKKIRNITTCPIIHICLLYTSDAADDSLRVDLCGRRYIKKTTLAVLCVSP